MNTLKIRNIGFAILMALALTFSVQGTADALTFGTTRTGDLKTYFPGDEFSITFNVKRKTAATIKNASDKTVNEEVGTDDERSVLMIPDYKVKDVLKTDGTWVARRTPKSGTIKAVGSTDQVTAATATCRMAPPK